ncbi:MAG: hypothetical protein L3K06_01275 [Thermoplasmata archaeon]|nr:hypothetical protein [Thermoplasmata archaeon]MCI4353981.1 hypothetical protein [Thermoplasmata archaeon]
MADIADRFPELRHLPGGRHPKHHLRLLTVAGILLAVAIVVGALLALSGLDGSGGNPTAPAPDPNPARVPVLAVHGSLSYSGSSSGYLAIVEGTNLCPQCPVVPETNDQFSPPVAGFAFFFNVTNLGSVWHTVGGFTISGPSYGGVPIFHVLAVFCCGPSYQESTESVGMVPGSTTGLMVFVAAPEIPGSGLPGYTLNFYAVSSD